MIQMVENTKKSNSVRLGKRIRDLRKRCNLTQEALAERAGISDGAIKMIETGRRWPREDTISAIAQALNVTIESLFGSKVYAAPKRFTGDEMTHEVLIPFMKAHESKNGPELLALVLGQHELVGKLRDEIAALKKEKNQLAPSSPIIREILGILSAFDEPKLRRALELVKVVRDDTRNQVDAPKKRKDIR